MIVESVKIITVPQINFSWTYTIVDYKRRIYYKNYAVQTDQQVNKVQVQPHEENRKSTILLKHQGKYYYCPLYEEIYKAIKGKASKANFKRNIQLENLMGKITLSFSFQKREYRTHEVKRIVVV